MRIFGGILLIVAGAAFGGTLHVLPETDALSHLDHLTQIVTAPPVALTAPPPAYASAEQAMDRPVRNEASNPRVFSPDQPLFAVPAPRPATRIAQAPTETVRGRLRTTSDAPRNGLPPFEPRAVDAVSRPLPLVPADASRTSSGARGGDARVALIRDLQRELKRVGCYEGDVDGSWGPGSKRAMTAFTERVNATLPVDQPDFILLTLVQGHRTLACGADCASGEIRTANGRCLPQAIHAKAPRDVSPARPPLETAAIPTATPTPPPAPVPARRLAKVTGSSAPFPAAHAAPATAAAPGSQGWRADVAIAPPLPKRAPQPPARLVEPSSAVASAPPATPLPGRMAVGVAPPAERAPAATGTAPSAALAAAREEALREAARDRAREAAERRARRIVEAREERVERAQRQRARPSYRPSTRRSNSFKNPAVVRDFFFSPSRNF